MVCRFVEAELEQFLVGKCHLGMECLMDKVVLGSELREWELGLVWKWCKLDHQ